MSDPSSFHNGNLMWSPQQLKERLGDENLAILDCRPTHEVMTGIIPGAAHIDLYGVGLTQTRPGYFEEFINLMRSQFGLRGAGTDKTVVIYDDSSGNRMARAFWLFEYIGHQDVHFLDGGMKSWRATGYEVASEMTPPKPKLLKLNPRPEIFINADDLNTKLGNPELVLLDTRSDKEWSGENKRGGPRGGTIPGAVHLEWRNLLDQEGCFKSAQELTTLFESVGVLRDKAIVPF